MTSATPHLRRILLAGLLASIGAAPVMLLAVLSPVPAGAQGVLDVCGLFSNISFENGNLGNWTLTAPNGDYILVPDLPNPVIDPSIDPADLANNPTTLTAPAGFHFTGVKQIGDTAIDLKYKLSHNVAAVAVAPGTSVRVTVWANRGRLEPFDTPVSTADLLVRMIGWSAGALPTVNSSDNWSRTITWNPAAQSFDFTGVSDGTWASRTLTFVSPAPTLAYLSISIGAFVFDDETRTGAIS